jgi:hypothetical protein
MALLPFRAVAADSSAQPGDIPWGLVAVQRTTPRKEEKIL